MGNDSLRLPTGRLRPRWPNNRRSGDILTGADVEQIIAKNEDEREAVVPETAGKEPEILTNDTHFLRMTIL